MTREFAVTLIAGAALLLLMGGAGLAGEMSEAGSKDEPVENCPRCAAHYYPKDGKTRGIGRSGEPDKKPTGHVRSLGADCCNPRPEPAAAQDVFAQAAVLAGAPKADSEKNSKIKTKNQEDHLTPGTPIVPKCYGKKKGRRQNEQEDGFKRHVQRFSFFAPGRSRPIRK